MYKKGVGKASGKPFEMCKGTLLLVAALAACSLVRCCLITNCPRGGKRSMIEGPIKQCISCGPAKSGRCFGPSICCGPFGCLVGTADTVRCLEEGQFNEREPCIAGSSPCKGGRCATNGICCNQESCYTDKACSKEDNPSRSPDSIPLEYFYKIIAPYQEAFRENLNYSK